MTPVLTHTVVIPWQRSAAMPSIQDVRVADFG
jgi:hypothetical protein